jgi:hypothetical protein
MRCSGVVPPKVCGDPPRKNWSLLFRLLAWFWAALKSSGFHDNGWAEFAMVKGSPPILGGPSCNPLNPRRAASAPPSARARLINSSMYCCSFVGLPIEY